MKRLKMTLGESFQVLAVVWEQPSKHCSFKELTIKDASFEYFLCHSREINIDIRLSKHLIYLFMSPNI